MMQRHVHPSSHSSARGRTIGTPLRYAVLTGLLFGGRRRSTMRRLVVSSGLSAGGSALDVGTGDGILASIAAEVVGPAGLSVGIDASPEMVAWAAQRYPAASFQVASADALPHPDREFDAVTCSLVLHHLEPDQRRLAVAEMKRVLKPGGRAVLAEVAAPSSGPLRLLGHLVGIDHMAAAAPELQPLLREAGLEVSDEQRAGPWIRYVVGRRPAES